MGLIVKILTMILRAFLPALMESTQPTAEEGKRRPGLRGRLRRRIGKTWGTAAMILVIIVALAVGGCVRNRAIYVPAGEPVRLGQTVRNVRVWVVDSKGKEVLVRMDLPEGWYCVEDTGPDE